MKREFVNYTLEGGIATVTIDHPPMNTFDVQTRNELGDAFGMGIGVKNGIVRLQPD